VGAAPNWARSLGGERPNQHFGGQRVEVRIAPEDAGDRLDRALQRHLPDMSRSRLKQLILDRCVGSGGPDGGKVLRDPATRVSPGQVVAVWLPAPEAAEPEAQSIALNVRFEDAHLIVIDKPAGMVVHPAPGNSEGTLVNALLAHCGPSLVGIGGVRRPGIVHRLDKDTSGLLVAAKTEAAHRALVEDFAARRIERAYNAVVWGIPLPASGEIAGNIGRSATNRKKMAVVAESRGKPAVTRYRVEQHFGSQRFDVAALLECRLLTGRTHQIRVHLANIGHSVIGDPVYGARPRGAISRLEPVGAEVAAFPRQALHARLLGFIHPATGEELRFESPLPADMVRLISNLELL
jgi:23S rRNA pseudouridine1911/1915/1917 synthase